MLSLAKPVTSVSGLLDFSLSFLWRYFSEDDGVIFTGMSTAIDENDYAGAGAYMGQFLKALFGAEIPDQTSSSSYSDTGGVIA